MKLHAPTAFTTLAVVGLVAILSAQQIVGSPAIVIRRIIDPVVVHQPAHPRDFVRIEEGTPFVVPNDRLLVVRSIGTRSDGQAQVSLWVNGSEEAERSKWVNGGGSGGGMIASMIELPVPGLTAGPGETVEVKGGGAAADDARAWGYLADN